MGRDYFVYILTNKYNRTLYIGVTNDLSRRLDEHKLKRLPSYSARYNLTKLVYYELFNDPYNAISREKVLKGWLRKKKIALIKGMNPKWNDLSNSL